MAGLAELRKFKSKGPALTGPLLFAVRAMNRVQLQVAPDFGIGGRPIRCGAINSIALATLATRAMPNGFPEGALAVECRGVGRRRPVKVGGAGR